VKKINSGEIMNINELMVQVNEWIKDIYNEVQKRYKDFTISITLDIDFSD